MEASVTGDDRLLEAVAEGEDWEAVLFDAACRAAQEAAVQLLEAVDERLYRQRSPGLRVATSKPRTVLTRFGAVTVRRRGYVEAASGRPRWLLDERLGWGKRRALSRTLQVLVADLAGEGSYRQAVRWVEKLVPHGPGKSTAHRLVDEVGAIQQALEQHQAAVLLEADTGPSGAQAQERLFVEADGLSVPLQRAGRRRAEVKAAVVYRGTRTVGVDRHGRVRRQTQGAVCYADLQERDDFWERFWGEVAQCYQLEALKELVLGGDGARWIRGALEMVGPGQRGVFQLDRFHLLRAVRRAFGTQAGPAVQAVRQENLVGLRAEVERALAKIPAGERRTALEALHGYLVANSDGLLCWTSQMGISAEGQPPLGSMETRIDKLLADRVAKRGMSWSPRGLAAMCKVRQLKANNQLHAACMRRPVSKPSQRPDRRHARRRLLPSQVPAQQLPFQARLAPRYGPHASRPWVQALIRLTQ